MSIVTSLADRRDWLPDYLADVRYLIHDASGDYFQDAELVAYINDARNHVAVDTGCLRTLEVVNFPANVRALNIGGVYSFNGNVPTPAGTAPYVLASGAGASATANANASGPPMSVSVNTGGTYYQAPLVSFDGGPQMNVSASATASLNAALPSPVASVDVNFDNGAYNAAGVTPGVILTSVGIPAQVQDNGSGSLQIVTQGAGQANGVVIVDAAGAVTSLAASQVNILDAMIASIDQVTVLWGTLPVTLKPMAYTDFNIAFRPTATYQQVPQAFSVFGNALYLGPVPNAVYTYELDCICYPQPLLNYSTLGQFTDPSCVMAVKFYAAYRARLAQNEANAAAALFNLYRDAVSWSGNRFTTRLSQPYPDNENLDF